MGVVCQNDVVLLKKRERHVSTPLLKVTGFNRNHSVTLDKHSRLHLSKNHGWNATVLQRDLKVGKV